MNWYIEVLKKYAVFDGRARRKEYWFFVLFNVIISIVLAVVDAAVGLSTDAGNVGVLGGIYSLAVLLPSIAVTVRRLHDTERSGWWILISFVPLVGGIILLVFTLFDGTPGPNKYGADPKGRGAASIGASPVPPAPPAASWDAAASTMPPSPAAPPQPTTPPTAAPPPPATVATTPPPPPPAESPAAPAETPASADEPSSTEPPAPPSVSPPTPPPLTPPPLS
jgi:uncharacterized membrane protein YhaH (DUF805 family)